MKILIIASLKESLVNFRGDLIDDLVEKGHDVYAAAPELDAQDETGRALLALGAKPLAVNLDRNGTNPIRDARSLLALIFLIRRLRPDIVLGYTIKPVTYGLLAARLCGVHTRVALVTGLGGALGGEIDRRHRMLIALHRIAFKGLRLAIFQNGSDLSFFRANNIIESGTGTLVVSGSGINLSRFAAKPVPLRPVTFLMVARLLRAKGVGEYAEAARQLKQKYPGARFVLAGWREDRPEFVSAQDVARWRAEHTVDYVGETKDVRQQLQDATVFVLPSYYPEGIPRTLLEALSFGRPVITTDQPGCRETVRQGQNGFLIEPRSADALVRACSYFLEKPDRALAMALASRQLAEDRFDVAKVNRMMIESIEKAASATAA